MDKIVGQICKHCFCLIRHFGTVSYNSTNFSRIFENVDWTSSKYKETSSLLENCPKECAMFIYASNSLIDSDGNVMLRGEIKKGTGTTEVMPSCCSKCKITLTGDFRWVKEGEYRYNFCEKCFELSRNFTKHATYHFVTKHDNAKEEKTT